MSWSEQPRKVQMSVEIASQVARSKWLLPQFGNLHQVKVEPRSLSVNLIASSTWSPSSRCMPAAWQYWMVTSCGNFVITRVTNETLLLHGSHSWLQNGVVIPSPTGLTPEKWKQTATLCLLDWPSNCSLLRLWHVTKDLHQFMDQLRKQMNHRHMFPHWEINHKKFASRVIYQLPAHRRPRGSVGMASLLCRWQIAGGGSIPGPRVRLKTVDPPKGNGLGQKKPVTGSLCSKKATLQQNVQDRDFPSRRVRKKPPQADIDEFKAKCRELRRFATTQEPSNPVSFALENSWTTTLKSDKLHFLEHTTLRMT